MPRPIVLAFAALALLLVTASGCRTGVPSDLEDLCSIFDERISWHRAARSSYQRWGVPEPLQLAIMHQESRFRARARPPRRRLLGLIPGPRVTSAYGYAQVKRGTWADYRDRTGRRGADRDDFADAADFIGWYANRIEEATGVPRSDVRRVYLAYHEGPAGYRKGTHRGKPWLLDVARKVELRAARYATQYEGCRESLEKRRRFWIF